jgi:hypothetical protein
MKSMMLMVQLGMVIRMQYGSSRKRSFGVASGESTKQLKLE